MLNSQFTFYYIYIKTYFGLTALEYDSLFTFYYIYIKTPPTLFQAL